MFKQVKFIVGSSLTDLEEQLNTHLCDLDVESNITYDFEKFIAVVETKSSCPSHICCECMHWEELSSGSLEGICKIRSLRRKFKDCACGKFEVRP